MENNAGKKEPYMVFDPPEIKNIHLDSVGEGEGGMI